MKNCLLVLFLLLVASLPAQNPNTAAFPTTVATDSDLLAAKRLSESTLSGTINSSTTSVTVADGTQFLQYAVIRIDNEEMKITGISSNTLTVSRGFNGTTAASHTTGATVRGIITSYHHNQLAAELKAVEARLRDQSGYVTTAGTSTAYTATLAPPWTAYADGTCFSAKIDETSGATPTMNVNGLGAKAIYERGGTTPAAAITTAALIANQIYRFCYNSSLNGGAGVFEVDPGGSAASGYSTIQDEGSGLTARTTVNFTGSGVSCADNAGSSRTDCTFSGGGASSVTDLTDFKVTKTSDTVLTVAGGNYRYLASDGTYTVASLPSATLTVAAGTETADPAVRFAIDENSGSPIIRCIVASSLTSGNYTASGCTKTSANVFPAGNYQLASAAISGGVWGTPVDGRTMAGVSNYTVDSTLTKNGKELGVNTAGSFLWGGPHTSDSTYNYCADAGVNDTYACNLSPAITAYVTGGHYFFRANTVNTGAATINFNSLGAVPIKKYTSTGGADLADADIRAGAIVEVIYDGTNMQLVNQLGNAGGGGTPGGSSTHVQYNSSGVFAGDSGFVYDSTNKILTLSRSNTSGMASIFRGLNTAGLSLNSGSRVELCHDNSPGTNCLMSEIVYANLDGSNQQWSRIYSYWSALAQTYPLIARKHTEGIVHVGGAANATVGYAAFTASGASRFADAATAGRGLVSIQGAPTELTSQTGNVAAQTLLAASHTAGMYRVCGFAAITSAGTGSTTAWTIAWRSPASGTDLTHNLFWSSGAAETDTFSVASANEFNVCKVIRSTGTSAISLDPGDMNTAVYNTAWTVERLR